MKVVVSWINLNKTVKKTKFRQFVELTKRFYVEKKAEQLRTN
jgi:hypothetical protein